MQPNVLASCLAGLRSAHLARCRATVYLLAGWSLLLWANWQIALGLFLVSLGMTALSRTNGTGGTL